MVFWQLTIDANDPARLAQFWAQALARLTELGATVVDRRVNDDPVDLVYFAVLQDPEGNEFCVG